MQENSSIPIAIHCSFDTIDLTLLSPCPLARLSGVPSKAYEFDDSQRAGGSQSFFFTPCVDSPKTCSVGGAPEQGSIVQFDNSDPSNLLCLGIIMHWVDPTDGTGGSFALIDTTDPTKGFTGYWANGDSSPGCATASGQREITITFTCQATGPASFSSDVESPACSHSAHFASCGACPGGCGAPPAPPAPPAGKCALIEGDPPIYKPVCAGATTKATCAPLNATCVWVPGHCDVKAGEPVAYKAICEAAQTVAACSALNLTCAWGTSSPQPFL